jgi:DNA polymerase-1
MKKLLLIDGSNVMFRAYYATAYTGNLMQNSSGQYTNAVFGFVNMINSLLKEDYSHILVAFDESGQTFRHELFDDYKAGRAKMPDEFRSQISLIKESLDVLGVKQLERHLIEADDIIGTYAEQFKDYFEHIEIVSNDKDMLQLVNDTVVVRASKKGMQNYILYTPHVVKEQLGVEPNQVIDLKGLMGDSSDNLPGVPGVGAKTAIKLLDEYQTLENLYEHTDELKGKLKERIEENKDMAFLCKQIATIKTDVSDLISVDELAYNGPLEEQMIPFFERLELHSLIKQYHRKTSKITKKLTITELNDFSVLSQMEESTLVLEFFGDNYHMATPLCFAIHHKDTTYTIDFKKAIEEPLFLSYLSDETLKKSVFDLKALIVILKRFEIELNGVEFDLLLAIYVLNPSLSKSDFKVVVSSFDFEIPLSYEEEVYGKGRNYAIPENIKYQQYSAQKAQVIDALREQLVKRLIDENQYKLFYDIELPLASVLADMESQGIVVDKNVLDKLDQKISTTLIDLEEMITTYAGESFNLNSPKQLGTILFEKLNLPYGKKTKTGYSTNVDVLSKLKGKHPIIDFIMDYRVLSKLHSTYIRGLGDAISEDGKIHTIYRQAFTSTGRLSSTDPNLQNIPIKYEEGREIRKIFIPENDYLLAYDYSQIELRVLAHMAEEINMIEAFKQDQDIHKATAEKIFGRGIVTPEQRRIAKAVNFGIIYGQTAWGLSSGINISKKEASDFIEKYNETFPDIKRFMDELIESATKKGYSETMFNRRRFIPEINSQYHQVQEQGKRNAMNAPIQGSAADIIKIAMVKLKKAFESKQIKSKMILQIHDELVFDVLESERELVEKTIENIMTTCVELKVPLKISKESGQNLYETK